MSDKKDKHDQVRDVPHEKALQKIFFRGSSMNPTLRRSDLLYVLPYARRKIRRGDVIVFQRPGSDNQVVHRVARTDELGIRTIGDNNPRRDPYIVQPDDIVGRVLLAQNGNTRRRIFGGNIGHLIGIAGRFRRLALQMLVKVFRGSYRRMARGTWVRRFIPRGWHPRLVCFQHWNGPAYQLIFRGRVVGRRPPQETAWRIEPPFRLIVDENTLPTTPTEPGE